MRDKKREFVDEFHKEVRGQGLENAVAVKLEELYEMIEKVAER